VKRVYGPVAQMDVDSARHRRLESAGVTLLPGRVPILALPLRKDGQRRTDPAGSVIVGRGRFGVHRDLLHLGGELADMEVRVPSGRYPCALEVHTGAGDVEVRGRVSVLHSWVPVAVTLLLGGGASEFAVDDLEVEEIWRAA
jgi:hypothetical protein